MPIAYGVYDSGQTLISRVVKKVTEREWLAYRDFLADNIKLGHGFHELVDLTSMVECDFTFESLENISQNKKKHADKFVGRRGAIVVSDPKIFELARYCEKLDSDNNEQTTVFNHVETALTWLGFSPQACDIARNKKPLPECFEIDG